MISGKIGQNSILKENNHPKIQDIIPRRGRTDSLLVKIMGPRPISSEPERNTAGSFLRFLSLMREKGGKTRLFPAGQGRAEPEEIIRLKKAVSPEPVSVPPKNVAPNKKRISVWRQISPRVPLALGVLCAAGIVILLSTVFARATVSLEPSIAELSLEGIRIEAGAGIVEIDAAGKKIPASFVETAVSLKREFSPSAKERVSRKARGTIRIYNAFSSAPQTLVAQTRFQDPSGRTFFLKQRVAVPGAAVQNGKLTPRFVSANVEAERAGAEFNIAPFRFTIPGFAGTPKFTGFYAESQETFTGGFEGEALVVRQADIDAASEEVTATLFAQLKEELERKIPQGTTVIPGAREIMVAALRKPKAGEAGERFFAEADGAASAVLFRMEDLFTLLGRLALSPDSGKKVLPEKSHLEFDRVSLSLKNRTLSFEVRGTFAAVSVALSDEFSRALAGRARADAENILRADSRIRAFGISIFPPWRRTVPSDQEKIRILVRE